MPPPSHQRYCVVHRRYFLGNGDCPQCVVVPRPAPRAMCRSHASFYADTCPVCVKSKVVTAADAGAGGKHYLYVPVILADDVAKQDKPTWLNQEYYWRTYGWDPQQPPGTFNADGEKNEYVIRKTACAITWGAGPPEEASETSVYANAIAAPTGKGPLSIVKEKDLLVVNGHGNPKGRSVCYEDKPAGKTWRVMYHKLAEMMKADGLPATHRFVKLLLCFGGGDANASPSLSPLALAPATNEFAKMLAISLRKLGYAKIVVGGHAYATQRGGGINSPGMVSVQRGGIWPIASNLAEYDSKAAFATYTKTTAFATSDSVGTTNWFDASGFKIPPPTLPVSEF